MLAAFQHEHHCRAHHVHCRKLPVSSALLATFRKWMLHSQSMLPSCSLSNESWLTDTVFVMMLRWKQPSRQWKPTSNNIWRVSTPSSSRRWEQPTSYLTFSSMQPRLTQSQTISSVDFIGLLRSVRNNNRFLGVWDHPMAQERVLDLQEWHTMALPHK